MEEQVGGLYVFLSPASANPEATCGDGGASGPPGSLSNDVEQNPPHTVLLWTYDSGKKQTFDLGVVITI